MRNPEVEQFLAHTRLASEEDAKADFERRVDVMREKLLASEGDEMKYSESQERVPAGQPGGGEFGSGGGATEAEHWLPSGPIHTLLEGTSWGSRFHPSEPELARRTRAKIEAAIAEGGRARGAGRQYRVSLTAEEHAALTEFVKVKGDVESMVARDEAGMGGTSERNPYMRLLRALEKSAPTGETKYSADQPRDHGRFSEGVSAKDYEGEDGNSSHITRTENGYLPVSAVARLRGAAGEQPGEHRNKQGAAWDSFKTDIARNGMRDPIFITKDWNKEAVISEGNHRRDAAVELGNVNVPVEIRYFGNAQKQGLVR